MEQVCLDLQLDRNRRDPLELLHNFSNYGCSVVFPELTTVALKEPLPHITEALPPTARCINHVLMAPVLKTGAVRRKELWRV